MIAKRKKTLAFAAATMLLLPALLYAGHQRSGGEGHHEPGAFIRHIAEQLELTTEQKKQIHEAIAGHAQELHSGLSAVQASRTVLFDAIHGEAFDEAAIRRAAHEAARAETELAVTRGRIVAEVRVLLTPEQQQKAREMLAEHRSHVGGFLGHVHEHLQGMLDGK